MEKRRGHVGDDQFRTTTIGAQHKPCLMAVGPDRISGNVDAIPQPVRMILLERKFARRNREIWTLIEPNATAAVDHSSAANSTLGLEHGRQGRAELPAILPVNDRAPEAGSTAIQLASDKGVRRRNQPMREDRKSVV